MVNNLGFLRLWNSYVQLVANGQHAAESKVMRAQFRFSL